jgi:hypothetical protein
MRYTHDCDTKGLSEDRIKLPESVFYLVLA